MKTRNILMIAAVAAFFSTTQLTAQNKSNAVRQDRADFNELLDKRCNRMCTILKLDDATAAKFTSLYKEYLKDMRACRPTPCKKGDKTKCTDADRKARIEKSIECREKMAQTQKKYYSQFEKFLTAKQLQTVFCNKRHAGQNCDRLGKHHGKCDKNNKNCETRNRKSCDRRSNKTHRN